MSKAYQRLAIWVCAFIYLLSCPFVHALAMEDIARQFHNDEFTPLLVGEQEVPLFDSPSHLPLSRGVAIVLVEPGNQGLSLGSAQALARFLNSKGWRTLLQPAMTAVSDVPISPANSNASNSAETTTADTASSADTANPPLYPNQVYTALYADYPTTETQLTQQVNALYGYAQRYSGYTFVIAEGMTAAALVPLFNKGQLNAPDTLVSISPYWPDRSENKRIASHISQSTYPVLDLTLPQGNQWQMSTVKARKYAAATGLKMHYRQRMLNTSHSYTVGGHYAEALSPEVRWLGNEVYSWLTYLGW